MTGNDVTHEDICTFCCEVSGGSYSNLFYDLDLATTRQGYILHETDYFVVFPCIGALTDWYVLIVSKRHVLSAGWLSLEERDDLRRILTYVRQRLFTMTGFDVITFEHGSYDFRDKGGACYDHAHIHMVATEHSSEGFVRRLPESVAMRECADWVEAARSLVLEHRRSYLALDSGFSKMIGAASGAPPQFFRRCLAAWLGAEEGEWDWLTYPQAKRVKRMIQRQL